jgi:aspartyl-tRNA(Asn)/glutamyl-tRNA(Gln) amidotransferase subunit B
MEYEPVIGLEVHVQLKTNTKMFTRAPYHYGAEPNTLTDPVVLGMPGTLPVMNKKAVEMTIKAGLLLGCKIPETSKWDRKNYFYPDMPKNYQISQFDQPICDGGEVEIEMEGASRNIMGEHRKVQLTRIHLEEDVGKLTHCESESLVDYNRAGAPLVEIVSEPDLYSADEAFAYLTALRNCLMAAGISECDMEKGQMRCDANISIRPKGTTELGTKVEIKNLNTISGVRNGIIYEIQRQTLAMENNQPIVQETRRWNAEEAYTTSMRSKEMAHDYRYFPDPDLMPVKVSKDWLDEVAKDIPELPFDKQRRYFTDYDLPYTLTSVLCPDAKLAAYFEEALNVYEKPKQIANFIANDLLRELSAAGGHGALPLEACKVQPAHIAELVQFIDKGEISSQIAKEVFPEMFQSGKAPGQIIDEKGLKQSTDTGELEAVCLEVIAKNPKPVEEFKEGKEAAINALKGQVMKATRGKANPKMVDDLLRQLLS